MKRFRWLLPLILLVAIGAVVWGNFYRSRTTGGLAVRAAPVKPGDVIALVNAPGVVAALQEVTVRAKIGAAVAAVLVKEGDRVTEGQALIRLEDRDLQTAVAQAEQAVAQSESALAALERRAALQGYYSLPTGRVSTRGTAQCRGAPLRVGVAGVQVGALAEGGGRLGAATGGP